MPCWSVVVVFEPVGPVIVTAASGTDPPEASTTNPEIEPLTADSWAAMGLAKKTASINTTSIANHLFDIDKTPLPVDLRVDVNSQLYGKLGGQVRHHWCLPKA